MIGETKMLFFKSWVVKFPEDENDTLVVTVVCF